MKDKLIRGNSVSPSNWQQAQQFGYLTKIWYFHLLLFLFPHFYPSFFWINEQFLGFRFLSSIGLLVLSLILCPIPAPIDTAPPPPPLSLSLFLSVDVLTASSTGILGQNEALMP